MRLEMVAKPQRFHALNEKMFPLYYHQLIAVIILSLRDNKFLLDGRPRCQIKTPTLQVKKSLMTSTRLATLGAFSAEWR